MIIKVIWLFLLFVVILLVACEPNTAKLVPETRKAPEIADASVVRPAWEVQWVKTLEKSKKERSVVIYAFAGVAPPIKEVITLFKERYGLVLEVISFGRGVEQSARLFSERDRGIYLADIAMSGMNTTIDSKKRGAFDPLEPALILPEVIDPKLWYEGQLPWGDKDRKIINYFLYPVSPIAINTQMVKIEEIKSYYDLLASKWKGKIVINDPTTSGVGSAFFSSLVFYKALDLDYFRQLVKQEPLVLRDQRLQIDWLAKGKYPVALWPTSQPVVEYRQAGAPISYTPVPKEGTYLQTGGSAITFINRAPHPNAARVFINWLLSREGQKHMQNFLKLQSAREDISTEGLDPLNMNMRKPGEKYLLSANVVEDWLLKEEDKYFDIAKQIFAPLVR